MTVGLPHFDQDFFHPAPRLTLLFERKKFDDKYKQDQPVVAYYYYTLTYLEGDL